MSDEKKSVIEIVTERMDRFFADPDSYDGPFSGITYGDVLPGGYFAFERGEVDEYEDSYVKCVRDPSGRVTMEGKPLKSPFIYEGDAK